MIINSISLKGLIPLQQIDITTLDINVLHPIFILIGDNGCGKSTTLRELTKSYATKTDYIKNGKRVVSGNYKNIPYVLSSDFSNSKNTHSFMKDTEELNINGITSIQMDLGVTHLNLTNIVDNLINFRYKMCSMGKSDRKKLFLSIHPSDLAFILEDHKRVSSELRGFKSNLKMLKERHLLLSNKMMDKDELNRLCEVRDKLNKNNLILDKVIYMVNHEIDILPKLNNSQFKDQNNLVNLIVFRCLSIQKKVCVTRDTHPIIFNRSFTLSDIKQSLSQQIFMDDQITKTAIDLKNEIQRLQESNIDIDNTLLELEKEIKNLTELKELTIVDNSIPILSTSELTYTKDTILSKLKDVLTSIHIINNKVYPLSFIVKIKNKLNLFKDKISYLHNELNKQNKIKQNLNDRYNKETISTFPIECNLTCDLKSNKVTILKNIQDELTNTTHTLKSIEIQYKRYLKITDLLQNKFEYLNLIEPYLNTINHIFQNVSWTKYIFRDNNLTHILNNNIFSIINDIQLIIRNTELNNCRIKYENQLNIVQSKYNALKESNRPTRDVIIKSISDKQNLLSDKIDEHSLIKKKITYLKSIVETSTQISEYKQELDNMLKQLNDYTDYLELKYTLQLYSKIIEDCTIQKDKVNKSLREIETTIDEQKGYHVRFNDEIVPSINEISKKEIQWGHVEKALSPTTGLPHLYMVRYLNNTISNVNRVLSTICGYPLVIDYMDERKPLDFTLPIKVKTGHKVSDISRCSEGQKQLIDLAWIIVICQQLGINKTHPLILDEYESCLTHYHRMKVFELLVKLINQGDLSQLFIVSHYASMQNMPNSQVCCLSSENITVPENINEGIRME